jgi:hypothetical protein
MFLLFIQLLNLSSFSLFKFLQLHKWVNSTFNLALSVLINNILKLIF